jgi:glycolate oxidase iron-sulfur subunit
VVSSNPGCLLQIRAAMEKLGCPLPVYHMIELLDASIRNTPLP